MKRITMIKLRVLLLMIAVLAVIYIMTLIPVKIAHAKQDKNIEVTYISRQIDYGDTLWSISKDYYTEEAGEFKNYLSAIRYCNDLKDDTIHAGCYLVIPIYADKNSH